MNHLHSPQFHLQIHINSRRIAEDASTWNTFARSVVTHEFGHSLLLPDNPDTTSASIMKHNRNRNTIYLPQTWDRNRVSEIY